MSLINRDFDDFLEPGFGFSGAMMPSFRSFGGEMTNWSPKVDVRETEDEVQIEAELPGMKKDEVNLEYDPSNRVLTLSGESKREKKNESDKYYRMERSYGSFSRSFTMPDNIKSDEINGKMEEGVLHVKVPKEKKSEKTNKINIQ